MLRRTVRLFLEWTIITFSTVFILPFLYLLEPFLKVRLTHIWSDRIGHFCFNTHIFFTSQQNRPDPPNMIRIIFGWKPCNETLFRLWQRVIPLRRSRVLAALYHLTKSIPAWRRFHSAMPHKLNDYAAINNRGPILRLERDEEEQGRRLLEKIGVDPDGWFVAFHCRDAVFHARRADGPFTDIRHHRNADIATYMLAAERIAARGGWAIRIGSAVEKPLPDSGNPRIIDYATHHHSDFGDIFLCARTRFFLGSASGLQSIPPLFDIPVGMGQYLPAIPVALKRQSRYTPKHLRDKSSGEILPYREWQRLGLYDPRQLPAWDHFDTYQAHGLEIIDNTPEEIADLADEMLDLFDGIPDPEEATRLQELFVERFLAGIPELEHAPRVSARFALRHRHLIES